MSLSSRKHNHESDIMWQYPDEEPVDFCEIWDTPLCKVSVRCILQWMLPPSLWYWYAQTASGLCYRLPSCLNNVELRYLVITEDFYNRPMKGMLAAVILLVRWHFHRLGGGNRYKLGFPFIFLSRVLLCFIIQQYVRKRMVRCQRQ